MAKKQFAVEQYNDAKVVGKELGINFVGKTKQAFIDLVNEALAAKEKPVKKEKWHTNGYGFNFQDKVKIQSKTIEKNGVVKEILQGREAVIIGPSANEGMVKAYLIDDKTGETLNCPITLEIKKINLINNKVEV